jgi:co-chaperonin GroES (HSP10)
MKLKTKEVKPRNENVLVSLKVQEEINEDGVYIGEEKAATPVNIEYYYGQVESMGELAASKEQCPKLKIGDWVIFSQFSGVAIGTEDKYTKLIRGYDVVAISSKMNMNKKTIKPTADRILVEVLPEGELNEDGMYVATSDDPREKQTQEGVVISCGPESRDKYPAGTKVHFDPYCGNPIVNDGKIFLKTVNSFDILFTT